MSVKVTELACELLPLLDMSGKETKLKSELVLSTSNGNTSSSSSNICEESDRQLISNNDERKLENEDESYSAVIQLPWYKSYKNWIKISIILILITVLTLALVFNKITKNIFEDFLNWMIENTVAGAFAFILLYWIATIFMIPGSILTLGAAFVFAQVIGVYAGIFLAVFVVFIGASMGATSAFVLGRFVLREKVEELKKKYPKFDLMDKVIKLNGLKVTFLLRLSPLLPFNVFNYAMGLTSVTFRDYNLALFGMLPGTLAYCFIGGTLGALADADSVGFKDPIVLIITIVGTVIAIIGMVYVAWLAKKQFTKLAEQIERDEAESARNNSNGSDDAVEDGIIIS